MLPIQSRTKTALPYPARKALIDSLCERAYTCISQGLSFTVANSDNANFIAHYLAFVYQTGFIVQFDPHDGVYHILPE